MVADSGKQGNSQMGGPEPPRVSGKHHVETIINYYNDPGDGSPPMPVYVGSNKVTNERPMIATPMTVTDITGDEDKFTLDKNGFQYHKHISQEKVFPGQEQLQESYFPECEKLLKDVTGASRVLVFDPMIRRGPSHWHKLGDGNVKARGPLHRAHVDQSYDGAVLCLRQYLPDEADELMKKGRWQIINIWRPIRKVLKDPLALADANTVSDSDLVAASIIYPSKRSESWTVKANPEHRWYFKYGLEPDEVVFIKCFDSDTTVARRAPHCAFVDSTEAENESRESVEVRCLAFYDS